MPCRCVVRRELDFGAENRCIWDEVVHEMTNLETREEAEIDSRSRYEGWLLSRGPLNGEWNRKSHHKPGRAATTADTRQLSAERGPDASSLVRQTARPVIVRAPLGCDHWMHVGRCCRLEER